MATWRKMTITTLNGDAHEEDGGMEEEEDHYFPERKWHGGRGA